mmetsp:Transcript_14356/g.21678  ORF Transcript_14356/g.21678 Transcript_14356/m.21678 type:complete len:1105 (+) Transcript_14356:109-3423(+)|eukprot:CAMPEP_0197317786 /NCGR_PEP_ID=MMETSP0891-20130614/48474_1 /TAXON_ID=44058 ORGANISM="Aureoumbra lagunensis, Strain CCMP1510" /NCGR_SAMPLE_ID=MMETSP0891 /ASSEMBLY_ACC=CAM_ASM_000534 /LENGTH=1104 /DNA_ID=CAMNT_0042807945 /DNA_START=114 /DNA_END=3428 /DNA_ORIENTATION=-
MLWTMLVLSAVLFRSSKSLSGVRKWGARITREQLRQTQAKATTSVTCENKNEIKDILKSRLDTRLYRIVDIGPVRALLCSDADADEAAIGVSVRVGSFDDDPIRAGISHFHEHMVFLGTKSFPDDGSFDEWLASVGGRSNAFTADEETNYYLSVNYDAIEEALHRLGEFFTAPEMRRDCVEREVDAVNSEYEMSLNDDGWRILSVMKAIADAEHPFSKFNCGNLQTLVGSTQNAENYDALHETLWQWHKRYYTAERFRLCVVSRQSLQEIESMVRNSPFANIRRASSVIEKKPAKINVFPWPASLVQKRVEIVPVRELRSAQIAWQRQTSKGLDRLAEVISSHIVGHEDVGSLYFELKRRGFIEALSFGSAMRWRDSQLVELGLELTRLGEEEIDHVYTMSFAWLQLCQDADLSTLERLARDWCRVQQLKFEYQEREASPESFVSAMAENLWDFPDQPLIEPQLFIFAPPEDDTYVLARAVRNVLQSYTPQDCFLIQMRPGLNDDCGLTTEFFYGAKYRVTQIENDRLHSWKQVNSLDFTNLRLPRPNAFVASDLGLRSFSAKGLKFHEHNQLWRRYDYGDAPISVTRSPKAVIRFFLRSNTLPSVSMLAAQRLILNLITSELNPERYDAALAGMQFGVSSDSSTGITLSVSGFSDKIQTCFSLLLQALFLSVHRLATEEENQLHYIPPTASNEFVQPASELLSSVSTSLDLKVFEQKFLLEREELARKCDDRCRDEPASIAQSIAALSLDRDAIGFDEFGKAVRASEMHASAAKLKDTLASAELESYTAGNLDDDEAIRLLDSIHKTREIFFGSSSAQSSHRKSHRRLTMVPSGVVVAIEGRALRPSEPPGLAFIGTPPPEAQDDEEPNSASRMVWQLWQMGKEDFAVESGWKSAAERDSALALLCHIAEPSAFRRLRTEQQLGYLVSVDIDVLNGVSIFGVTVQSAKIGPIALEEHIFAWLDSFRAEVESMSDADLKTYKNGLADAILNRATCLQDIVDRDLAEIRNQRRFFSRRSLRAHYIRHITAREHLLKILDDAILHPQNTRLLRSRVYAPDLAPQVHPDSKGDTIFLRSYEDIRLFHANQPQWPPAVRWNETEFTHS